MQLNSRCVLILVALLGLSLGKEESRTKNKVIIGGQEVVLGNAYKSCQCVPPIDVILETYNSDFEEITEAVSEMCECSIEFDTVLFSPRQATIDIRSILKRIWDKFKAMAFFTSLDLVL